METFYGQLYTITYPKYQEINQEETTYDTGSILHYLVYPMVGPVSRRPSSRSLGTREAECLFLICRLFWSIPTISAFDSILPNSVAPVFI